MGVRPGYTSSYSYENTQGVFSEVSVSILTLKMMRRHGVRSPDSMFLEEEKKKREKLNKSSKNTKATKIIEWDLLTSFTESVQTSFVS